MNCNAPRCGKPVPPSLLFCSEHWPKIPKPLRKKLTGNRTPSQLDKAVNEAKERLNVR